MYSTSYALDEDYADDPHDFGEESWNAYCGEDFDSDEELDESYGLYEEDIDLGDDALYEPESSEEADAEYEEAWEDQEGFPLEESDSSDDTTELANTLRDVLHEDYSGASSEELQGALHNIVNNMTPAEAINFGVALKAIKSPVVAKVAGVALPIAGAAVGTYFGGPAGTAVGGALGKAAGQALSSSQTAKASAKPTIPVPVIPSVAPPSAAPVAGPISPHAGSQAALQLLQLTQNPDMLKSLLALALGNYGRTAIPVGSTGQTQPVGAFMNLLNTRAAQAAVDADILLRQGQTSSQPDHTAQEGEAIDLAAPEERATALYSALVNAANESIPAGSAATHPWTDYFPFRRDSVLLVEYETWVRNFDIGSAKVLQRTNGQLKLHIHIDKWDQFNVPETDATIDMLYRQEGRGNSARAEIVVNKSGKSTLADDNVEIRSGKKSRAIQLSIDLLGQRMDSITIWKDSSSVAKIMFKAQGKEHVLVLTKK